MQKGKRQMRSSPIHGILFVGSFYHTAFVLNRTSLSGEFCMWLRRVQQNIGRYYTLSD
jgi:hypothetical protein